MARPRPLSAYPPSYASWFHDAYLYGEHRVVCASREEARALRMQLYAFREALRQRPSSSLSNKAETLSFPIEQTTLVLRRRNAPQGGATITGDQP